MRWLVISLLVASALAPVRGAAQVSVTVQLSDEVYLLYEPVLVTVSIRNITTRTIELTAKSAEAGWLSFLILDDNGRRVDELKPVPVGESTLLPAGDTVSRTFNLTPLYDLRSRGSYRLRALINNGGVDVSSVVARFAIFNGQEIWSQTVGLAGAPDTAEEFRTYSLIVKRGPRYNHLFAEVSDDRNGLVYGMLTLGHFVPVSAPQTLVDRLGDLHVLHRSAARSVSYHHIDAGGRVIEQSAYSDLQSYPRLVVDNEGRVSIRGGEKAVPHVARVMTEEELQPPPPPPPPPKKKWWWPFGPSQPKPPQ